jgi:hypothetical protein
VNQASKVDESEFRRVSAACAARFASVRFVDAVDRSSRDSVFHLAAAYPRPGGRRSDSREKHCLRDQPVPACVGVAACGMSCVLADLFPDSVGDSPSRTRSTHPVLRVLHVRESTGAEIQAHELPRSAEGLGLVLGCP